MREIVSIGKWWIRFFGMEGVSWTWNFVKLTRQTGVFNLLAAHSYYDLFPQVFLFFTFIFLQRCEYKIKQAWSSDPHLQYLTSWKSINSQPKTFKLLLLIVMLITSLVLLFTFWLVWFRFFFVVRCLQYFYQWRFLFF